MYLDGLRAEGSEWHAEDGEGRLEQVDSGTESADDRYANITTQFTLTYCNTSILVMQKYLTVS